LFPVSLLLEDGDSVEGVEMLAIPVEETGSGMIDALI
jgi:hypothetical protein